jgi:hypothetical protein
VSHAKNVTDRSLKSDATEISLKETMLIMKNFDEQESERLLRIFLDQEWEKVEVDPGLKITKYVENEWIKEGKREGKGVLKGIVGGRREWTLGELNYVFHLQEGKCLHLGVVVPFKRLSVDRYVFILTSG